MKCLPKLSFFLLLTLLTTAPSLSSPIARADDAPVAAEAAAKYPTVEMHSIFAPRDKMKEIVYFTPNQRKQLRVTIEDGIVKHSGGNVFPDTNTPEGKHINYVMDENGVFFLFDEYTYEMIRHSSIFAGGPVAGAGDIGIKDGKIFYIDSHSGHYPTMPLFPNVLRALESYGVDLRTVENHP